MSRLAPKEQLSDVGIDPCSSDFDEVYQPCIAAQNAFVATANKLCAKYKLPPLDAALVHSWEDVEDSLSDACSILEGLADKDTEIPPGFTGKLKAAFRNLCNRSGAGTTLVNLVPTDSYCSVLCGGLKIIFKALEKTGQYRREIYTALENIPFVLNDHAAVIRLNMGDCDLHKRAAGLYASIFNLMDVIVTWFMRSSTGRFPSNAPPIPSTQDWLTQCGPYSNWSEDVGGPKSLFRQT